MTEMEIINRFMHHPPTSEVVIKAHETIREGCAGLALVLNLLLPESREKSLAMTKLEEVMSWSHASIAREQKVNTPYDPNREEFPLLALTGDFNILEKKFQGIFNK